MMFDFHQRLFWNIALVGAFVCDISIAVAEPTREELNFFEQRVRPALVEHCYRCHSEKAEKLKGNLYLDSKAGWEKGGDYGEPAIVPGDAASSLLIKSIQHLEAGLEMPPDRPKLPDAVIADLVMWVKMGAPDPRDGKVIEAKRADKSWWSLQPLRVEFEHDSIDGFVRAELATKQLAQNPEADPRDLIRRMTYDVTGLPPSAEEVETFVEDFRECRDNPSQDRLVAELVDRLLASPRYGERWGRHWLDVVRFGESNGFERNFVIDDLYHFRDYVIRSINDDKPFNQFIIEHLAGDVIGANDPAIEVGSAFIVAGPYDDVGNQDVVAQANIRAATIDDMITATASAFLGLTVNCARCHNHKFDPIPTEDYYRLRAAFEGTKHGRRVVSTENERTAFEAQMKPLTTQLKAIEKQKAELERDLETRAKLAFESFKPTRPKIDVFGTDEMFEPIEAKFLKFVIHRLTTDTTNKPERSGVGGKLTEFQVWSAHDKSRNVALASNGTTAEGAKSTVAEDFPEAYGPQYCIDGKLGEAWFIGRPSVLTLTFAKTELIERITFINARGERDTDESKVAGGSPCEYEVQVSTDGVTWKTVASDAGREPWTTGHGIAAVRRNIITDEETEQLNRLDRKIAEIKRKIAGVKPLPVMWVGTHSQPEEKTFVHLGGDPMKPTDEALPASLEVLDELLPKYTLASDSNEGERRLKLGQWITDDRNALTARVLANRVWHYHFGTGIVDTPSDFGFLGSKPTHPALLDYLAQRLIANGWRWKPLHREILMSKTYRQASTVRDDAARIDKDSRLLWRFPPRRLSAEEVRDTLLTVAGKMQLEPMGGPGFRLYKFTQNNVCTYFPLDHVGPETYRRAVYHQNARASVVDILTDFDLPDIAFASPKRAVTTTPLQALTLLNHSFTMDMAKALAARIDTKPIEKSLYDDIVAAPEDEPVIQAFQIAFQRDPTKDETLASKKLIAIYGLEAFCRALLNSNELIYID